MGFYKECPDCGANLDPGEKCDCRREKERTAPQAKESCSKKPPIALTATATVIIA